MQKLRGFLKAFAVIALALFTSTASADPFTPIDQPRGPQPFIVIVQTPDGWMCCEFLDRTSIRFCGDNPTNLTDPLGLDPDAVDYLQAYWNGYVRNLPWQIADPTGGVRQALSATQSIVGGHPENIVPGVSQAKTVINSVDNYATAKGDVARAEVIINTTESAVSLYLFGRMAPGLRTPAGAPSPAGAPVNAPVASDVVAPETPSAPTPVQVEAEVSHDGPQRTQQLEPQQQMQKQQQQVAAEARAKEQSEVEDRMEDAHEREFRDKRTRQPGDPRPGKNGLPDHIDTNDRLEEMARSEFPNDIIHRGKSIRGKTGINREPDVWVEDANTRAVKKVYEAARKTPEGEWVDRELAKKNEYDKAGIPSHFEEVK